MDFLTRGKRPNQCKFKGSFARIVQTNSVESRSAHSVQSDLDLPIHDGQSDLDLRCPRRAV